jgi:hypothetical protein
VGQAFRNRDAYISGRDDKVWGGRGQGLRWFIWVQPNLCFPYNPGDWRLLPYDTVPCDACYLRSSPQSVRNPGFLSP